MGGVDICVWNVLYTSSVSNTWSVAVEECGGVPNYEVYPTHLCYQFTNIYCIMFAYWVPVAVNGSDMPAT